MNRDQILSTLRTAITAIVAYAAGRHWLGDDTATLILSILPVFGPLVWGVISHSDYAKVIAAANVDGATVVVDPKAAPAAAVEAAKDPSVPGVELKPK